MESYFKASYDEQLTFALYEAFIEDESLLEELLAQVCPLVRRMVKYECRGNYRGELGRLEADALVSAYHVIAAKDVPTHHPRVFTTFLSTVIVRSVRDSKSRMGTQVFEFWKVARAPPTGRIEGVEVVEKELYRQQFTNDIRNLARSRIRFLREEADACKFIIDCELGLKNVNPRAAKSRFRINSHRCMYLIRYARILIKAAAIELREREREGGAFSPVWETGGDLLRAPSEFREVQFPAGVV